MAEYILKDRYGRDHTFDNETIYVRGVDGELMEFTQGTADPTKITILREQRFDGFVLDATYGAYSPGYVTPAQFALKNGEKYYVKWDGTEYECVAMAFEHSGMSMVFIGNGTVLGLSGNGEPFMMTYNEGYNNTQLFSSNANSYHTVGIKQKAPGGSSDDVRYVTFMSHDGLIEYGKKAVAVGDDCADPIARGVFDTPTRESDAQYNYTFYGWATTPNGAANSSALKAVEEDRTVYANFASTVRYYTITYYDSDGTTVLKTESLAYGTMPSYAPTKENYMFGGWTPSAVAVTGNASYTAVWEEKLTFASGSWAKIAEVCAAGKAAETFAVGDKKPITLNYDDGTSETINFTIVDMGVDPLSDGSKASLTIMADNIVAISPTALSTSSTQYRVLLHYMDTAKSFLTRIYNAMPEDLRSVIKPYKYGSLSIHYTNIFVAHSVNLGISHSGMNLSSQLDTPVYNAMYKYFNTNSRLRTKLNDTSADDYWTAACVNYSSAGNMSEVAAFVVIDGTSNMSTRQNSVYTSHGIVPCFCI